MSHTPSWHCYQLWHSSELLSHHSLHHMNLIMYHTSYWHRITFNFQPHTIQYLYTDSLFVHGFPSFTLWSVIKQAFMLCPITLMWHCWQTWLVQVMAPLLSLPHYFWDSQDLVPMLKLGSPQLPTWIPPIVQVSFIIPPNTASLYLYLCMLWLCYVLPPHLLLPDPCISHTSDILINAVFPDPVFRLNFVWCCSCLNIQPCSWTPKPWTSVSGLLEIIFVTSITL